MLQTIRRNINLTSLVAVVALVFAMTGGAYAAGKYLVTSTKQISPKVLKSLQGKAGKAGASGAQGPAGPQGPAGAAGVNGKEGPAGKEGATGPSGKEGATGKEGQEGEKGEEGSPWTAGGTLPAGRTETGAWAYGPEPTGIGRSLAVPISFTLPLAATLDASHVHFIAESGGEVTTSAGATETSTACTGSVEAPTAMPGNLCVYTGEMEESGFAWNGSIRNVTFPTTGASTAGAQLVVNSVEANAYGIGTWAVTAEE